MKDMCPAKNFSHKLEDYIVPMGLLTDRALQSVYAVWSINVLDLCIPPVFAIHHNHTLYAAI